MSPRAPWVCLMYHDITDSSRASGGGPERFSVPVQEFRRQLLQLRELGLEGRTLRAAMAPDAARVVAITFDDGDTGQYERGFRTLAELGMTGTFFITTGWVGQPGRVTWDQLREMRSAGMDIQSHTRAHPFLSELDEARLTDELRGAKEALDRELGQDTDTLALPGGDWPRAALRRVIGMTGHRVVATSRWGLNGATANHSSGWATVRRCTVAGTPGAAAFGAVARGDARPLRQLRELALGTMRSALGPTRYATWRRSFLDAFDRSR